ncbi:MAG: alcohol dehydrogenase catalytic domain-containing protein, partial [Proteobacteria bacterium]|nr:alcohol dehydrogenase catalytic domain-containing protein [Pseudomonadota bacterium]
MESVQFQTPEYQPDGTFKTAAYEFQGSPFRGWKIFRNGKLSLELEPGFVVVKSLFCGICATDLARRFLPYPLPQIIGHEVVGLVEGTPVVAEINASHRARNRNWQSCPYCSGGLDSHCPDRITLGIDRLPGGFAPYFLVPVKAMMEIPESVSPLAACVTEPLAAALQGVEASLPCPDDKVAVLGPRRLGTLILAALSGFRKRKALDFEIAALVRHPELREICLKMGADRVLNLNEVSDGSLNRSFDIVFDTTGTPEGFAAALDLTRRVLHLKSTNGLEVMGLRHLTD